MFSVCFARKAVKLTNVLISNWIKTYLCKPIM